VRRLIPSHSAHTSTSRLKGLFRRIPRALPVHLPRCLLAFKWKFPAELFYGILALTAQG
jgi:hypothetical protein